MRKGTSSDAYVAKRECTQLSLNGNEVVKTIDYLIFVITDVIFYDSCYDKVNYRVHFAPSFSIQDCKLENPSVWAFYRL